MYVGLSTCPHHASGNVGDQLITEASIDLLKEESKNLDIDIYFRREDFTSRLDKINEAKAILVLGLAISTSNIIPKYYRIAEDIDKVQPPIIPISSIFKFFPGHIDLLNHHKLENSTTKFIDRIVPNCPDKKIPVRTKWVGKVLENNGYKSKLVGDPAWYDPEYIGQEFHKPEKIEQLVFTPPHMNLYIPQAKRLIKKLSKEFPEAEKIISFQSALDQTDREIRKFSIRHDWKISYTSHDTSNLEFYKNSDLHVGYRKHGHLAHLRWRIPSVVIAEDSRAMGLTDTFGTAGFPGFKLRLPSSVVSGVKNISSTKVGQGMKGILFHLPYPRGGGVAKANPNLVSDVMDYIEKEKENDWESFSKIRNKIDRTYCDEMKPFIKYIVNNY